MDEIAIHVENLSKRYQLGHLQQRHDTLRDQLVAGVKAPFQRWRAARSGAPVADDTLWALKDVSFDVRRGEVVGIIGRNGAGKSTLLKILSRITEPTSGRAVINGRVGSLLEVGTGFHPELTGRENIYLNGAILGMRRVEIERKFDEIVAFSEIEKFLDTPVKRYSSGMYVRLAFAVAAHLEPEILLVDEVLAVGDAEFQKKCLGKMGDVAKEGRTVLFVSHNMSAVQRLCESSMLVKNGQLDRYGRTQDVIPEYISGNLADRSRPKTWINLNESQRTGNGKIRFEQVMYSSDDPQIAYMAYTQGPLDVSLIIHSVDDFSLNSLSVILFDQYGNKLINADTVSRGEIIACKKGRNEVIVRVTALNLNPGIFSLGLWMSDWKGSNYDVLDFMPSAVSIEVIKREDSTKGVRADGIVACDFAVVEKRRQNA